MELRRMRKIQNRINIDTYYGDSRQLFAVYVGNNPTLYDGVELDDATIDYINNYFYEYKVNPQNFERNFMQTLRRVVPRYNMLKKIELDEEIFAITTNSTIRKIVRNATSELTRNGTGEKNTANTGTVKNDGTESGSSTTTNNLTTTTNTANDSKQASKNLPMKNEGDFDQLFDWSGASQVNENIEDNTSTVKQTGTVGVSTNGKNGNTQTLNTNIKTTDVNTLKDIGTNAGTDDETIETTSGQVVDLVRNIWQYLIEPKSIDYLVEELKSCFILII